MKEKSKQLWCTIMVTLVTIALLVGCAGLPKLESLIEKPLELDGLYLTTDEKQMSGVARDRVKLSVGESVVVYARGKSSVETGGKWFVLPPDVVVNWKADRELEVMPTTGHTITVKVIKPISVAAYVTAQITTIEGKKIESDFVVEKK